MMNPDLDLTAKLQTVLGEEIPLTKAIGITVHKITNDAIELYAPLINNINHKSTAFGGSLYSVAVLSGWSLIYVQLLKNNIRAHIVIQESNINYKIPVSSDIYALCQLEDEEKIRKTIQLFHRKGIARIHLTTKIYEQNKLAVLFEGKYVIHN